MKIYHHLDEFRTLSKAVVTTGTFDGVHIGHRKILQRLCDVSRKVKGESVLLTFFPHPRMVLQPDAEVRMINSQEEKIDLLRESGIDHLIIHPFTLEFSRIKSLDFVRNILVNHIGAKHLVIGYDHHFGRNREGSFEHLVEYGPLYGFEVEEIPPQETDEITVSSTKIRKALEEGEVQTAAEYLGYRFMLTGTVSRGEGIGRKIGFPTANIDVKEDYKLIPADGVYAVTVETYGDSGGASPKPAMCNIGFRPTLNGKERRIECHIFDFDEDIYDRRIRLHFSARIRDEVKFDGLDGLKAQLEKDAVEARKILA